MAKTKRARNLNNNDLSRKLMGEIKCDPNKVPAYVPPAYISKSSAMRKEHLTSDDLEKIKASAIYGVRKGQEGIFYPPIDIKTLVFEKESLNKIDDEMLSEATILKQLPKGYFDREYLDYMRSF